MAIDPMEYFRRYSSINDLISKRGQYNVDPLPQYDYLDQIDSVMGTSERLRMKSIQQALTNSSIGLANQYQAPANFIFPSIPNGGGGSFFSRGRGGGGGRINPQGLGPVNRNAAIIANVGRKLGGSRKDIITALTAALAEGGLRNPGHGDRDSLGNFQQRAPWGSVRQRMNPRSSARMFYQGGQGGQEGLFDVGNRRSRGIGALAQEVEESGNPSAYKPQIEVARRILNHLNRMQQHSTVHNLPNRHPGKHGNRATHGHPSKKRERLL